MSITPELLARSGSESGEMQALFCWASQPEQFERYGNLLRWLHHIPNGGARGESELGAKIRGGKLKAEGVKPGVADIFLPIAAKPMTSHMRFCGLYIEMKRRNGKPSDISDQQKEFRDFVTSQGYAWVCCFGWQQAVATIEAYLHEFVKQST